MRKSERFKRNQRIVKFKQDHPEYSLEEIGEKFPRNGKPLTAAAISLILKNSRELVK
jgi:DNA-binding transcriptional regulator WhiA